MSENCTLESEKEKMELDFKTNAPDLFSSLTEYVNNLSNTAPTITINYSTEGTSI